MPKKRTKLAVKKKHQKPAYASKLFVGPSAISLWKKPGWGLPETFYIKLKYYDLITFTASGTYGEVSYRINGPYDPETAAGGDYPLYYDNLAAMYTRQCTMGSTIKLSYTPGSNNGAAIMGTLVCYPHLTSTGVTDLKSAKDQRGSKSITTTLFGNQLTLYNKCATKDIFGVSASVINNDYGTFSSATLGLPSQQAYWVVGFQPSELTPTAASVQIHVEQIMYIRFSGFKAADAQDSAND